MPSPYKAHWVSHQLQRFAWLHCSNKAFLRIIRMDHNIPVLLLYSLPFWGNENLAFRAVSLGFSRLSMTTLLLIYSPIDVTIFVTEFVCLTSKSLRYGTINIWQYLFQRLLPSTYHTFGPTIMLPKCLLTGMSLFHVSLLRAKSLELYDEDPTTFFVTGTHL